MSDIGWELKDHPDLEGDFVVSVRSVIWGILFPETKEYRHFNEWTAKQRIEYLGTLWALWEIVRPSDETYTDDYPTPTFVYEFVYERLRWHLQDKFEDIVNKYHNEDE